MKSTFEKMGGTYILGADGIYYPDLVSTDEEPHYGKYGMMRKTYLKEHRLAMYSLYMLEDRLTEHLNNQNYRLLMQFYPLFSPLKLSYVLFHN